jgi:hypothetical protein
MEIRRPKDDEELRFWLQNMIWWHHMGDEEIANVTGMELAELQRERARLDISVNNRPKRREGAPLMVLPYPGGRHPRIQFLEGAIDPQRETKVSIFAPWDEFSYAVADVPEAIWSNLGLTYLAHQHIDTVWTKQGIELPKLEWTRREDGGLELDRTLPNGIAFGTQVKPSEKSLVRMEHWLRNGTSAPLSDLRVQMCVMLKGMNGFENLTQENKVYRAPFAACRNGAGNRWIITAWTRCHRVWGNPPCPCIHSDPKFPDTAPGETHRLRGFVSFYEGKDVHAEFDRLTEADLL